MKTRNRVQERHQAAVGGSTQAEELCGIQEDRLGQPGGATAQSGAGCSATGEPRQCWGRAELSGPLSSVLGLLEGSSLQWAGAVLQLTVSYLWF